MADITLTPEQIEALRIAAMPVLTLIAEYQGRYIDTEFKVNEEPSDPDVLPPQPHSGKPRTYLQVLTTRLPLPSATVGQIPSPVAPNRLDDHPADQRFSAADLHWVFPKMPFAFSVFSKQRDNKLFYAVNFLLRVDGNLFQFTEDVFPIGDPDPQPEPKWQFVDEHPAWLPHC